MREFDVAVAGSGLAGSLAALAFAHDGFQVALIAPENTRRDRRTTALMDHSIQLLQRLDLWEAVRPHAAALRTMQIIDGTERLLRAPTVAFHASEIGLDAFGYNFPNAALLDQLAEAIAQSGKIEIISASVRDARISDDRTELDLDDDTTVSARLVIAADGRKSLIRGKAGIDVRNTTYPQTAIVLNFAHERLHGDVSTEFHTTTGPFTQVPLEPRRSSLVWVVRPEDAAMLMDMRPDALNRRIEERMQSMLGKIEVEDGWQAWPLSAMTATSFGKHSVVLIGEAAHVFPPIGAQGLNLSLRDIERAVALAAERRARGETLAIGSEYDRARRADILSRTASIDLLNRSLLSDFLPVQLARAAGLHVLSAVAPIRQMVMQEGVEPGRAFRGFPDRLREKIGRKQA